MISKLLVMTCVLGVYPSLAVGQSTQSGSISSPAGTRETASGEKSLTGCVAREGGAFVLKTDEGTYEFNTDRDLSPYVGKRVRILGSWKATGVTTTAPAASVSTEQPASAGSPSAAPSSFAGDLHLHISGTVVGDCAQPQ